MRYTLIERLQAFIHPDTIHPKQLDAAIELNRKITKLSRDLEIERRLTAEAEKDLEANRASFRQAMRWYGAAVADWKESTPGGFEWKRIQPRLKEHHKQIKRLRKLAGF